MKTLKRNQIVVFVIGLMIIAAGYLSFTNNGEDASLEASSLADSEELASIGDAKLVSANIAESNIIDTNIIVNETVETETTISENAVAEESNSIVNDLAQESDASVETNTQTITTDEYFTNSRLERNTMYSQQVANYQEILSNTNISETQKQTAQEEITRINNEQKLVFPGEICHNTIVRRKPCLSEEAVNP